MSRLTVIDPRSNRKIQIPNYTLHPDVESAFDGGAKKVLEVICQRMFNPEQTA